MNTNKLLFKNIILLVALLLTCVFATFAWFHHQTSVDVDGFTGDVTAENLSEISGTGENWGFSLEFNKDGGSFLFTPVTGNGLNFYKQNFKTQNTTINTANGSYTVQTQVADGFSPILVADWNKYLYATTFYMRNSLDNRAVFLDSATFLNPIDDLGEDGIVNGELSADAICGATRVAVQKKVGDVYKTLFIWAPHTTYQLSGSDTTGYTFQTNGAVESSIVYRSGTNGASTVTINTQGNPAGLVQIDEVIYLWGDLEDISALSSTRVDVTEVGGTDYEYRMVIWIEGTDRECNNRLTGGRFDVKLSFSVGNVEAL